MKSFFYPENNQLMKLFLVISSFSLAVACSVQTPRADAQPVPPEALTIDHQTALEVIDDSPWDFLTDFASPYRCELTAGTPRQAEPDWVEPVTIWQRIRLGYQLDLSVEHRRIDAQFNWYSRNPEYMARVSKRAERYIHYVTEELERRDLPMELALLPIVESAYDPFAYSHGRAAGMWQFIPGTARYYDLSINWWYDGRRDIVASTRGALDYLEKLHSYYDGDWLLALAAYNSGQGNVNKALRKNRRRGEPLDFWSLDLPRETRAYVPKLLALAKLVNDPLRYNVHLYPVPNQPYFAVVDTGSQIDLAEAAKLAEIEIDELYRLNPGFNKWATAPEGPHRLAVPVAAEERFAQNLADLPPEERLHWKRYTVEPGDSLLLLAKRHNTGVDTIRQVNNIRGNIIRAGQPLLIPVASESGGHYALSAEQRRTAIQNRQRGEDREQVFHTVQSGDSFWTIARQYGVKVSQLARWNGMSPRDTLRPGQKLSVWTQQPVQARIQQRESVVRKVGYRVRSGDSLARIAGRFNVSISDIVKWNAVNPDNYLQPGQHLTLYVDVMNAVN